MKGSRKNQTIMTLLKGRTFFVLALLILFFAIKSPSFLRPTSVISVVRHVSLYGILGVGMTFIIITGGIDLSVGSVVGLTGMNAGGLIYQGLTLAPFGVTL